MKKTLLLLFTCMVVVVVFSTTAMALELGARAYYWFPELSSGDLRVDGKGLDGTTVKLKDDLGMSDESYPIIEAFAGLGSHHLSFSCYRAEYDGREILNKEIIFNGKTYAKNTSIVTELDYDVFDIKYQYDVLDLENILAGFSLGLVGEVKIIDGSVGIRSAAISTKEEFTVPIPMLGLNAHVGLLADLLEARAQVTGMGYGGGTIFDGFAEITFTPFPLIDIHGGYRAFMVNVDADDVEFDYNTAGPYVAVTVGF